MSKDWYNFLFKDGDGAEIKVSAASFEKAKERALKGTGSDKVVLIESKTVMIGDTND